jgi:hypothetical protein
MFHDMYLRMESLHLKELKMGWRTTVNNYSYEGTENGLEDNCQ